MELVGKLPLTLKVLYLKDTGCFGGSGKADWSRLPALEAVDLSDTKVTGSEEELRETIEELRTAAAGAKAEG